MANSWCGSRGQYGKKKYTYCLIAKHKSDRGTYFVHHKYIYFCFITHCWRYDVILFITNQWFQTVCFLVCDCSIVDELTDDNDARIYWWSKRQWNHGIHNILHTVISSRLSSCDIWITNEPRWITGIHNLNSFLHRLFVRSKHILYFQ